MSVGGIRRPLGMRRRGYTVIELLLVLGIGGVLAIIAVPRSDTAWAVINAVGQVEPR